MKKNIIKGVGLALALIFVLPGLLALAFNWTVEYTVTESSGNAYTSVGVFGSSNNTYYASQGYINANGLNTHVYAGNTTIPHMLTTDRTYWAMTLPALNTQTVTYALGDTAVTSFDIIPGYGGYVTTPDDATLELGSAFDLSIPGYAMPYVGAGQNLWYKSGAGKLDVSAASTVTFHALNADNTDNWTLSGTAAPGAHTFRVWADGVTAYLYVDGVEQDTYELLASDFISLGNITTSSSYSGQGMSFYAEGLDWVFYYTATGVSFKTSDDNGSTWSAATDLLTDSLTVAPNFSIAFDGTNAHYVRVDTVAPPNVIYYRMFAPQSDGSITWAAAEQTVGSDATAIRPSIAISEPSGNPFIAYFADSGVNDNAAVTTSSTSNGTWTTAGGYPQTFSRISPTAGSYPMLAPFLDSDRMILVYYSTSPAVGLMARYYDGGVWGGSNEVILASGVPPGGLTTDADGAAYAVYNASGTAKLVKRSAGGSWGSPVTIYAVGAFSNAVASYDSDSNKVFLAYSHTGVGMYFKIFDVATSTLSDEYTIGTGTTNNVFTAAPRFANLHLSFTNYASTPILFFGLLSFPWSWNDNANDHVWMGGNSMSYADNMTVSVSGSQVLRYAPDSMISGTTLPDESGNGNDGIFTWGGLPAGVGVVLSAFVGNAPARAPPYAVEGTEPDWVATSNMTGGFGTTVSPKGPFAQIIIDAATAGATPSQLPFMILTLVVILAISFLVSHTWRRAAANSPLWAKGVLCIGMIGIAVALQYWDWWMLFFYVIFFAALGLASRHQSFHT